MLKKPQVTLLLIMLAFSYTARAEQALALLFYENPPFVEIVDGKPQGFMFELTLNVMERLEQPYLIEVLPFKRALESAKRDQGLVVGVLKNEQREHFLDFSSAMFTEHIVLAVPAGSAFTFSSSQALQGKNIGTLLGWSYGKKFDDYLKDGLFNAVNGTREKNIERLLKERIDLMIDSYLALYQILKSTGLASQVEILSPSLGREGIYLAAAKGKHQLFLSEFSAALHQFRQSQDYQSLLKAYSLEGALGL